MSKKTCYECENSMYQPSSFAVLMFFLLVKDVLKDSK